jgi:molybdopterin synthase sulfur carrier subunit
VGQLRLELMEISPQHAEALAPHKAVRAALNQVACTEDAALSDGDEVAFFPPVTGG